MEEPAFESERFEAFLAWLPVEEKGMRNFEQRGNPILLALKHLAKARSIVQSNSFNDAVVADTQSSDTSLKLSLKIVCLSRFSTEFARCRPATLFVNND